MDPAPPKKNSLTSILLAILLAPFAVGFIIAASLAAGPSEALRAVFGRRRTRDR